MTKFQDKFASLRLKTAPLAEISLKYVEETCIGKITTVRIFVNFADLPEFGGSTTVRNFRSLARRGGNSGFSFSGSYKLLLRPLYKVIAANSGVGRVAL